MWWYCFLLVLLLSSLRERRCRWRCSCLPRIFAAAWLWRTGSCRLALPQLVPCVACFGRKQIWSFCACRRLLLVLVVSAVLVARFCVGLDNNKNIII